MSSETGPNLRFNPNARVSKPGSPPTTIGPRASETRRILSNQEIYRRKLQIAMQSAVDHEDLVKIMRALVSAAIKGNISAAKEVLDRTVGKAVETDVSDRLAELEAIIKSGKVHVDEAV